MGRVGSLPGVAIARASSGDMIAVAASAYSSTLTGTYRISRPTTAPISAAGSVRSNGGVPAREPIRTPTPRPASRCATRVRSCRCRRSRVRVRSCRRVFARHV